MEEIYKPIKSFENYAVSNFGNIKRITNGRHTYPGKIIKKLVNNCGYEFVVLYNKGKHKQLLVHRLVAEAFLENNYNLKEINHIDRNKLNNNVENLRWVNHKENLNNIVTRYHNTKSESNYKVIHTMYGIWYATSLYGASKTIGCSPSLIYNNIYRKNTFKEWTIEKTDLDFSKIPAEYINADNEFVKKFHMDTLMHIESLFADDICPKLDEVQLNIIRMSR